MTSRICFSTFFYQRFGAVFHEHGVLWITAVVLRNWMFSNM